MKKDYKHPKFKAVELKVERLLDGPSAVREAQGSINGGSGNAPSTTSFFSLDAEDTDESNFDFDL